MRSFSRSEAIDRFRRILHRGGVRAALRYLNELSAHRFTAVFRFEGGTLRNLHLIDKLDPRVERCPDQPVLESYCLYVRQTAEPFVTEHAAEDPRVDEDHPKRRTVQSYCGIPLVDEAGELFGTICHFDFEPVTFSDDEVYLLEESAADLVRAILATEWSLEPELAAGAHASGG